MHERLADKVTHGERELAAEPRQAAPIEREIRLDPVPSREAMIRARMAVGFYQSPAVADVVARRMVANGDV